MKCLFPEIAEQETTGSDNMILGLVRLKAFASVYTIPEFQPVSRSS